MTTAPPSEHASGDARYPPASCACCASTAFSAPASSGSSPVPSSATTTTMNASSVESLRNAGGGGITASDLPGATYSMRRRCFEKTRRGRFGVGRGWQSNSSKETPSASSSSARTRNVPMDSSSASTLCMRGMSASAASLVRTTCPPCPASETAAMRSTPSPPKTVWCVYPCVPLLHVPGGAACTPMRTRGPRKITSSVSSSATAANCGTDKTSFGQS